MPMAALIPGPFCFVLKQMICSESICIFLLGRFVLGVLCIMGQCQLGEATRWNDHWHLSRWTHFHKNSDAYRIVSERMTDKCWAKSAARKCTRPSCLYWQLIFLRLLPGRKYQSCSFQWLGWLCSSSLHFPIFPVFQTWGNTFFYKVSTFIVLIVTCLP